MCKLIEWTETIRMIGNLESIKMRTKFLKLVPVHSTNTIRKNIQKAILNEEKRINTAIKYHNMRLSE